MAEINQNDQDFFISFLLSGNLASIDLGTRTPNKERTIKLWEKTCFELFIKNARNEYMEFNFSPCFEWNCFYFQKKGDPLRELIKMQKPKTDILLSLEKFFLVSEIKKEFLPEGFLTDNNMSVGISAVLKLDQSDQMTYWALNHQDSRPNFHHLNSFVSIDSFKYKS
jgi:hypothetical protein